MMFTHMAFGPFDPELVEVTYTQAGAELPFHVKSVAVYAIGGGTVGRKYADNYWGYEVIFDDGRAVSGTNFRSGSAVDHKTVAKTVAEMAAAAEYVRHVYDAAEDSYDGQEDVNELWLHYHLAEPE